MTHTHNFDPLSGWCSQCGLRDDGRLISRAGQIFHSGNNADPEQIQRDKGRR